MAAARRRSSDLLGVLNRPGLAHLRTVATLIRVQANGDGLLLQRNYTMVKVTPDPPDFLSEDALLNRRAIDYYLKASAPDAPTFILNDNLSLEDALAHAADLLHCAVGTAHSSGEAMDVQQRAVMHLVEMAKGVVDQALECVQPR